MSQPPPPGPWGQQPPPPGQYGPPPQQYPQQPQPQYGLPNLYQQGNPYGPPPQQQPPTAAGPTVATHLRRAVDWNVAEVKVTPREMQQLASAGIPEARFQGLLAWRRSSLIVALPVLVLSVILSIKDTADGGTDGLTDIGKLWIWLPTIGLTLVPIGAGLSISRWTEARNTSKVLLLCWAGSVAIPLLAALMPIEFLVDFDSLRATAASADDLALIDAYILSLRTTVALSYAVQLLPTIISVPSGVLKGAQRVKSMFPAAMLPGWFLVMVAPFYSLFMIVVFVLIEQLVGNLLLVLGVGLLAFAPWLFVVYRRIYEQPMTVKVAKVELGRVSRISGWVTAAGLGCLAIFAVTAKVGGAKVVGDTDDGAYFGFLQVIQTSAEVLSRGFVTAVVFSVIFVNMAYNEWKIASTMPQDVRAEHDAEMYVLQRFAHTSSTWKPGQP